MKYLNLLLLLGLSVFMFSCNDDDEADPRDVNPIYFQTQSSFTLDVEGDFNGATVESVKFEDIQVNFDHSKNEIRIVSKIVPKVGGAAAVVEVPFVHDVTFNSVNSTRSDSYSYSINVEQGSSYNQSLSLASSCVADPGYGAGTSDRSVSIDNFIQWDNTKSQYYMSTAALLGFLLGVVDPGFTLPPGVDPDFGNVPNIYQTTGSIKGCSELPTNLPN